MFAAMLRVKNEARWIADVVRSITPLCETVFIMDDHSTDDTVDIANAFDCTEVFRSPFQGLDEARDKNWLYDRVMERGKPEWILCVDGDEVLEPGGQEKLRRICETGTADAYRLKIRYLWGDPKTVRVDRVYGHFYRPSLFRPFYPKPDTPDDLKIAAEFRWMSTPFGKLKNGDKPNLHCSSVPQRRIHGAPNIEVGLLHYGYMLREDRVKKLDFYTSVDWKNPAEDSYRHMTQGDNVTIDELPKTRELLRLGKIGMADVRYMLDTPATASLVHAGPMEFESL